MADLHQTRHQLLNKGTGKRSTTTYTTKPQQVETSLEIPTRNATLQDDHSTNTPTTSTRTHRPEHLAIGQDPKHKKINNKRIHRDNDGIQAGVALSSAQSELYSHSQLHQRSNNHKSEHPHTHRQPKRKEHCNKNLFFKESETH